MARSPRPRSESAIRGALLLRARVFLGLVEAVLVLGDGRLTAGALTARRRGCTFPAAEHDGCADVRRALRRDDGIDKEG
jgi:hypothetical protein